MLRYAADCRTLGYLGATVALAVIQWSLPSFNAALYAIYMFMGVAIAVVSHNHNHLSIWRSGILNQLTNYVTSVIYGHPAIAWVPTHNQNHHHYNNREGDTGRSPVFFRSNHLLALLIYPTVTAIRQQRDIKRFLKQLWAKDRRACWWAISEYVVYFGFMVAVLIFNWRKALLYHVIPQQFALFVIQIFNYVQHIDADPESEWNHSRNFVSPILNGLLFNNGYHTVHHYKPGVHWSKTPALHREHAAKIDAAMQVKSWWSWMFKTFLMPGGASPVRRLSSKGA